MGARERLNWRHAPFEVPKRIVKSWREAGARHRAAYEAWSQAASRLDAAARAGLTDPIDGAVKSKIAAAIGAAKAAFVKDAAKLATRQSSQKVLEALVPVVPGLVGGSADLTGSNGTLTKLHSLVKPGDFAGQLHPLRRARARHGGGHERARAAWRHRALWRHLPRVLRLLPALDQAVGADGAAGDLRHDARLDRARRGRPDPPAGRAAGGAPRHAQSQRDAPGRLGRMRRVLGDRVALSQDAVDPRADPPGRPAAPRRRTARRTCRPRAPMC